MPRYPPKDERDDHYQAEDRAEAKIDEKMIRRQRAIISSMTIDERHRPKVIQASRKRRIATGSGTSVQEVNKLLKQFQMMNKMMTLLS